VKPSGPSEALLQTKLVEVMAFLKDDAPQSVSVQYTTGKEQRNSSIKNEWLRKIVNDTQLWIRLV